jgi:hypothetical protein
MSAMEIVCTIHSVGRVQDVLDEIESSLGPYSMVISQKLNGRFKIHTTPARVSLISDAMKQFGDDVEIYSYV